MQCRAYTPTFSIGMEVLVIKQDDRLFSFSGKVVAHPDSNTVKLKFDFTKKPKPKTKGYENGVSNIQYRVFEITDLIENSKISRLLYG